LRKDMEIKIIDEVGENCITPDDGALIYGKIYPAIDRRSVNVVEKR